MRSPPSNHTLPTRRQRTRILMLCTKYFPDLYSRQVTKKQHRSLAPQTTACIHAARNHTEGTQHSRGALGAGQCSRAKSAHSNPRHRGCMGCRSPRCSTMSFYAGGLPAERQPARRSCTYLLTHPAWPCSAAVRGRRGSESTVGRPGDSMVSDRNVAADSGELELTQHN